MSEFELPKIRPATPPPASAPHAGPDTGSRQRKHESTAAAAAGVQKGSVFSERGVEIVDLENTLSRLAPKDTRKQPPASPASTLFTPASEPRSEASVMGTLMVDDAVSVDPESLLSTPPDRSKLKKYQVSAAIERASLAGNVKAHAISLPLVSFDPAENPISKEMLDNFRKEIWHSSQNRNSTETSALASLGAELDEVVTELNTSFKDFKDDYKSFLETQGRKKADTATLGDKAKRHLFGRETHAVLTRSTLQSVAVAIAGYGLQVGTVSGLKAMFENNPELVPSSALEKQREALGPLASDKEVSDAAITDLSRPGSTYLDTATNSDLVIYISEAIIGWMRGTLVPAADSLTAVADRQQKLDEAIESAGTEPVEKTKREIFDDASSKSFKKQLPANVASGVLASLIATGLAGDTKGSTVVLETGKTMGFALITAKLNAMVDGYRKANYPDDSPDVSEMRKAGMRVFGARFAQQIAKESVSLIQSGFDRSFKDRSLPADALRVGIQGIVGGAVKEVSGTITQIATNHNLPADEVLAKSSVNVISAISKLQRLTNSDATSLLLPASDGSSPRTKLYDELEMVLQQVKDASTVKFEDSEFDTDYGIFMRELQPYVEAARAGTTSSSDENLIEPSGPTKISYGAPDGEDIDSQIDDDDNFDIELGSVKRFEI